MTGRPRGVALVTDSTVGIERLTPQIRCTVVPLTLEVMVVGAGVDSIFPCAAGVSVAVPSADGGCSTDCPSVGVGSGIVPPNG